MGFIDWLGDNIPIGKALSGIGGLLHSNADSQAGVLYNRLNPQEQQAYIAKFGKPPVSSSPTGGNNVGVFQPYHESDPTALFGIPGVKSTLQNFDQGIQNAYGPNSDYAQNSILERLQALQDPSRYLPDSNELQRQAMLQASQQYDPIISGLKGQETSAQARATTNQAKLAQMYAALTSSLQGEVPQVERINKDTSDKTASAYDQLQQSIQGQYAKSHDDQMALLQRLNLEAAAPDVFKQQDTNQNFQLGQAKTNAQTAQDALNLEGQGALNFTRQGADISQAEGTNRQADVMSNLQDLLNALEGKIGENQAAKQSAIAGNYSSLANSAQKQALDSSQRDFQNYLSTIQLGRQLTSDRLAQSNVGNTAVKNLADVPSRASYFGLSPASASNIQNVFASALSGNQQLLSGYDQNLLPLTPYAKASTVMEAGRNAGLNQQELNALQNIALEYFK